MWLIPCGILALFIFVPVLNWKEVKGFQGTGVFVMFIGFVFVIVGRVVSSRNEVPTELQMAWFQVGVPSIIIGFAVMFLGFWLNVRHDHPRTRT
ncbi:MAG: hypothetical protein H6797_02045 [Candidatus Nomurabacteria bacterium]|nr:MAG: hypothetical protein H6797_02045 [Candidatus Nomurabacteria bacterium]